MLKTDRGKSFQKSRSGTLLGAMLGLRIDQNRARDARKIKKTSKKVVLGGSRFLTIFSIAFLTNFGAKMGQTRSPGQVIFRKKIEQNVHLLLPSCSWLRPGASGHVFCRFWGRFCTMFSCCWGPAAHAQHWKTHPENSFAIFWATHPQKYFLRGGGLAKRPQYFDRHDIVHPNLNLTFLVVILMFLHLIVNPLIWFCF